MASFSVQSRQTGHKSRGMLSSSVSGVNFSKIRVLNVLDPAVTCFLFRRFKISLVALLEFEYSTPLLGGRGGGAQMRKGKIILPAFGNHDTSELSFRYC